MGKKRGGVNRTQQVREYVSEHPDQSTAEVLSGLQRQGITVSSSLVSNVRRELGLTQGRGKKKAPKKKAAGTKAATMPGEAAAAPARDKLSAEDLFEAKKLADELGGIEQARRALDMLERLR